MLCPFSRRGVASFAGMAVIVKKERVKRGGQDFPPEKPQAEQLYKTIKHRLVYFRSAETKLGVGMEQSRLLSYGTCRFCVIEES